MEWLGIVVIVVMLLLFVASLFTPWTAIPWIDFGGGRQQPPDKSVMASFEDEVVAPGRNQPPNDQAR